MPSYSKSRGGGYITDGWMNLNSASATRLQRFAAAEQDGFIDPILIRMVFAFVAANAGEWPDWIASSARCSARLLEA